MQNIQVITVCGQVYCFANVFRMSSAPPEYSATIQVQQGVAYPPPQGPPPPGFYYQPQPAQQPIPVTVQIQQNPQVQAYVIAGPGNCSRCGVSFMASYDINVSVLICDIEAHSKKTHLILVTSQFFLRVSECHFGATID